MDTIGSLIDKLATVNQKMFINQEMLYAIRRMTFDEFRVAYLDTEAAARSLFDRLVKCCDLNVQRAQLVNEVDEKILNLVKQARAGEELDDGANLQRAHKTY